MKVKKRGALRYGGWVAVVAWLMVGALLVSWAEEDAQPAQPLRLTLDEAVALALENNYDIRIATQAIGAATASVSEAQAARRVQLGLQANYSRLGPQVSFDIPTPTGTESIQVGPEKAWDYGLSLYKSLYSSGRNQALVRLSALNVDISELQAAIARRQVELATTQTFLSVIQAQQLAQVARQTVASATDHWRLAQAHFEAGAAPKFDVLRAEVDIANARQDLIAAENGIQLTKTALKQILALELTTPLELVAPPEPVPISVRLSDCIDLARQRRQEILAARKSVQLFQVQGRLAAAQRGINLDLVGGYQRKSAAGFSADYNWNVTLSLNKPIIDGGAASAKEQQAYHRREQARLAVEQLKQQVAAQVQDAYLKLQEAKSRLHATAKTVQQAEEALRLAQVRYSAGVGRAVEVTDARVALTAARTNHVNVLYGYQTAEAQLVSAVNVPRDQLPISSSQE